MDVGKGAAAAATEEPTTAQAPNATPLNPAAKPQLAKVEDAPDPDEDFPDPDEDFPDDDDLDDLDDELDQFIAPPKPATAPKPPAESSKGKAPNGSGSAEETMTNEEFAKDLSSEMHKLMAEIDDSPEMQAQLEEMFATMQKAADSEVNATSRPGTSSSKAGPKASFKDTIAGLTNQLNNSNKATTDNLTSGAAAADEEALLSQLLSSLSAGGLGGEGGSSEDDITNMLVGMMEQLTAKEILYDPMKELQRSFPDWMEKNKDAVSEEEMKAHREQLRLVSEIVGKFEEPGYSDEDAERRKYIVDRMQAMQSTGSIPPALMGESQSMQEAFSADGGCNPQ